MRSALMLIVAIAAAAVGWLSADRWFARQWHGERAEVAKLRARYARTTWDRKEHAPTAESKSSIRFEDAAARLGIDFAYDDAATGQFHLMETIGGGMAVADFDRDGRLDVFFPNGCRLPLDPANEPRRSACFLCVGPATRERESRFSDVASVAGVDLKMYGHGASAADFDHDGFDDLLVTGFHSLRLFRNQGDGTFIPQSLPIDTDENARKRWWTSAAWFDADDDGNLDLYVCAYATVDIEHPKDCRRGDVRMHCHPSAYVAQPDLFFRNNGDGSFTDATKTFGLSESVGRGLGVAVADFTGNGRPAVYVANDSTDAFLWVREPGGRLTYSNQAAALGVGLTGSGATMAGMGVAVGDYDRNGLPDLFVTDFFEAGGSLFASFGKQGFVPKSAAVGLLGPTRRRLGFGAVFLDADLDGWPDLAMVNGHVSDLTSLGIPYKMKAQLFRNEGGRRFVDLSESSGEFFRRPLLGRGLATGDFNDDGRLDLVVSNIRDQAALLLNRTTDSGDWVGFDFIGRRSARGTLNVRVEIRRGSSVDRYEQHSGGGFLSSSDPRYVVGLGKTGSPDEVVVRWPSGRRQLLVRPERNRYHVVIEPLDDLP